MPEKAEAAWRVIGGIGALADVKHSDLAVLDTAGWKVTKGAPLFPKPEKVAATG
jgi:methionyl-tRNA synthetase